MQRIHSNPSHRRPDLDREGQPERQLHYTRVSRQRGDGSYAAQAKIAIRKREHRRIGEIEDFPAQWMTSKFGMAKRFDYQAGENSIPAIPYDDTFEAANLFLATGRMEGEVLPLIGLSATERQRLREIYRWFPNGGFESQGRAYFTDLDDAGILRLVFLPRCRPASVMAYSEGRAAHQGQTEVPLANLSQDSGFTKIKISPDTDSSSRAMGERKTESHNP